MRKIIVLTFLTLDGILQSPGGPDEDPSGGFTIGGWAVPYFDEFIGQTMGEQTGKPFDLLLGRKTFELFAAYWPQHNEEGPEINSATKYVVSNTLKAHEWEKSVFLTNVDEIKTLKQSDGPDLQVHGSGNLIQTLLKNDLVDELWLKIFPVIVGKGKRLFEEGAAPAAFKVTSSQVSPSGVIVANYVRNGEVKTGTF